MKHLLKKKIKTTFDLKKILEKIPEKISDQLLFYRDSLGDGCFLMKDASFGFFAEIKGFNQLFLTEEENSEILNKISDLMAFSFRNFFEDDNYDVVLQIFSSQKNDSENDFKMDFFKEQEKYIENKFSFFQRKTYFAARISLRKKIEDKNNLINFFKNRDVLENKENEEFVGKMKSFFREFSRSSKNFELFPIGESEFVNFINSRTSSFSTEFLEGKNIGNALVCEDFREKENVLEFESKKIECFFFDQIPDGLSIPFGQIAKFQNNFDIKNFDFVWTFSNIKTTPKEDFNAKIAWFERRPRSKELENLLNFKDQISPFNPFGKMSLRVFCYSDDSKNFLKNSGLDLLRSRVVFENQIPTHLFFSSLPMNCLSCQNDLKGGRSKTVDLKNALFFAPIFPSKKRIKGEIPFQGLFREKVSLDLFSGVGNKMTLVLGQSGGGKSVLISLFLIDFISRFKNSPLKIIDTKTSYEKLFDLKNGEKIFFDNSILENGSFNPFAIGDPSDDDFENLKLLIETIIFSKNEEIKYTAIHSIILKKAISVCFSGWKNWRIENESFFPNWQDIKSFFPSIVNVLKEEDGINDALLYVEDLIKWTICLDSGGDYGKVFSSKIIFANENQKDNTLSLYDMDGIKDPILRKIAVICTVNAVLKSFKKSGIKENKLLVIEEFGVLLQDEKKSSEIIEKFVRNLVKTARKENIQIIGISNDVEDFSKTEAGKSLWSNSTQKVFLPLGSMLEKLLEEYPHFFSSSEKQALSILHKNNEEKYSTALYKGSSDENNFSEFLKIPLSPFLQALTTTNAGDLFEYKKDKESFGAEIALNNLVKKYENSF